LFDPSSGTLLKAAELVKTEGFIAKPMAQRRRKATMEQRVFGYYEE